MSVYAISYVFALDIKSTAQKLVMLALANRISDDTGRCFPGQKLIAKECTMSERQVRKHLKDLDEGGLIARTERTNSLGRTSDEYEISGFMAWMNRNTADANEFRTGGNPPQPVPAEKGNQYRRKSVVSTGGNPPGNHKKNHKENHQLEIPLTPFAETEAPSPDVLDEIDEERMDDVFMNPYPEPVKVDEADEAYEFYRKVAVENGFPVPRRLTDKSRTKIKARIKDAGSVEGWKEAVKRAVRNPFLRGDRGDFCISLPWLLQAESFDRLINGMYDGKEKNKSNSGILPDGWSIAQ
jgi:hypothetical protein